MAPPTADGEAPGAGAGPARRPLHGGVGGRLTALLVAAFVLKLVVVLWGIDRGFELGDEGFFLLNLNRPGDSPRFYEFYKLLLLLDEPPRFGVVEARVLRLGAELVASAALVAGVAVWARARLFGRAVPVSGFVGVCLLGTLLSGASRAFSYNDATNLCTYAAVGGLFYVAARAPGARRTLAALGVGFACGFQLFVKFPAGLLLVPAVGFAVALLFVELERRERLRMLGLWSAGWAAALGLFVAANGGVAPLVAKFRAAAEVGRLAGYEPLRMLWRYGALEIWTGVNLALAGAAFAVAATLRARRRGPDGAVAGALWIAAGAMLAGVALLHSPFAPASATYLTACLALLLLVLGGLWLRRGPAAGEPGRRRALLPMLLLLALPIVNFVGTNVPFALRLASHVLPVFVALAVLVLDLGARAGFVRTARAAILLLVGLTSALFVRNHVLHPYGLPRPLFAQTRAVEGLPGLRVDPATRHFLEETATSLHEAGLQPGDPIVAFDYMPGLVFYLEGRSPGFPFYVFRRPLLNCFNLARAELREPPFLIFGRPPTTEQLACVDSFAFPEDFRPVRTLRFPYEEVYASFGGYGLSHVHLYAPAARDLEGGRSAR